MGSPRLGGVSGQPRGSVVLTSLSRCVPDTASSNGKEKLALFHNRLTALSLEVDVQQPVSSRPAFSLADLTLLMPWSARMTSLLHYRGMTTQL